MKTTVINIRDAPRGWMDDPKYTYIGRAGAGFSGEWGNPYVISFEKHRDKVLDLYKIWLDRQSREYKLRMIHDLEGQILVCFCSPKRCHGDIIIELINKYWRALDSV